eukprot:4613672-Amphidinium_carterae.1
MSKESESLARMLSISISKTCAIPASHVPSSYKILEKLGVKKRFANRINGRSSQRLGLPELITF